MTRIQIQKSIVIESYFIASMHGGIDGKNDRLKNESVQVFIDSIFLAFEDIYGLTKDDIVKGGRKRHIVELKKIFCYIVYDRYPFLNLDKIALQIGYLTKEKGDHASVIYAIRTCKELIEVDHLFRLKFKLIESQL